MRGKGGVFWNFESFNPPVSRSNWANMDILAERADRLVVKSSYLDVPRDWLSEQFFDEAAFLQQTNEKAYLHEYMGEPVGTGANVFDNITDRPIPDDEYARFDRLKFGIDFGFAVDEFAWVKLHYDSTRRVLYVLDEIYEQRLSNADAVKKINTKHLNSRNIADSAEPRTINEFRLLGLNIEGAVKGPDSVDHGFKFLQGLSEIVIDKARTPNAYKEFTLYEYERDRNGNCISAYPKKQDHILSAVRYSMESEMRQSRIVTSGLKLY
jgi:phage terminase large subunit